MPVLDTTVTAASGATLRTADGRTVIDFASGSFGYQHAGVLDAVSAQLRVLPQSTRMFLNRPLARLVTAVAAATPGPLSVTYPCNSATEGVEGALKLALGYHRRARRTGLVATLGSYHGTTRGALRVSRLDAAAAAAEPGAPIDVGFVAFGDAPAMRRAVAARRPAAVVLEPIACGAGVAIPPPGYYTAVREICDEFGALLIVNETVTGLGRTGRPFAMDAERVAPDILVLGAALGGNVIPVGAYVTTEEINGRVYGRRGPWLHGSATGGSPIACAAATAVLTAMTDDGLPERCRAVGGAVLAGLRQLRSDHPRLVTDVAGVGQLAAVRLRDAAAARAVARHALDCGVILWQGGVERGFLGIRPPLLCTAEEAEQGHGCLQKALAAAAEESAA
ncbi:aminotransferase class III-fold pyridoxal phosphate-dependent enzyme [Nocardia blacklockiae]|uniref:aminotransferase class III-fold pyridoxal phosphate-dependent enzyme n=1 Tax=Nocardia blacklockiae TaxID=480036 RepID=UPI0018932663|nr:aminotransferase class III-fold pyridoxal phosphate-dependent enzyme [Nocardia blacklockiae]MBF6169876.1 aminotransferase class III-fold pyridoxal phosphate-dependent enzyme [Nocardia blacklockiae]